MTSERGVVSTEDYDVEIEHVPEEVRFLNINDMRQVQTMQPELTGDTPNNRCFILRLLIHPSPQNDLIMTAEFEKNPRDLLVNFPSSPVIVLIWFTSKLIQVSEVWALVDNLGARKTNSTRLLFQVAHVLSISGRNSAPLRETISAGLFAYSRGSLGSELVR